MKLSRLSFALTLCVATSAHGFEIGFGGGKALTLDDFSGQATSVQPDRNSGPSFNLQLAQEIRPDLAVGLEVGYLFYSHFEFPASTGWSGYGREEYHLPILAIARFKVLAGLYAQGMAGVAINGIYVTTTTYTNGNPDTHLTPYLAFGTAIGYELKILSFLAIDPRVSLYFFNVAGLYTSASPTINLRLLL